MKLFVALAFVLACASATPRPRLRWLAEQTNTTAASPESHRNSTEEAAPASQHNTTQQSMNETNAADSTSQNTTFSNSTLSACKSTFPPTNAPKGWLKDSNFEDQKNSTWLRYTIAQLAPCLVQEGQCEKSLQDVNKLAGALGSVTQQVLLSQNWQNDTGKFADAVKTSPGEKSTVEENGWCVNTQAGGVEGFLDKFSQQVKDWAS